MPLIQELPNTTTTASPGWALVIDTGYDPSKEAIVPSGSRKQRTARNAQPGQSAAVTSKHLAKVQAYIEGLKRDTPKDLQIVVPGKSKDVAARGLTTKMTSGVKKILQSQKTFTNHLNDEEAMLANKPPDTPLQAASTSHRLANPKNSKMSLTSKGRTPSVKHTKLQENIQADDDTPMEDVSASQTTAPSASPNPDNEDPFFRSEVPDMPNTAELEELLGAPALPYSAAAAAASQSSAPPRQFCDICGYWGNIKCLRCNGRICGLDCKLRHEESQCYAF